MYQQTNVTKKLEIQHENYRFSSGLSEGTEPGNLLCAGVDVVFVGTATTRKIAGCQVNLKIDEHHTWF